MHSLISRNQQVGSELSDALDKTQDKGQELQPIKETREHDMEGPVDIGLKENLTPNPSNRNVDFTDTHEQKFSASPDVRNKKLHEAMGINIKLESKSVELTESEISPGGDHDAFKQDDD